MPKIRREKPTRIQPRGARAKQEESIETIEHTITDTEDTRILQLRSVRLKSEPEDRVSQWRIEQAFLVFTILALLLLFVPAMIQSG